MSSFSEILEAIGKTYDTKDQNEWLKDPQQYELRAAITETSRFMRDVKLNYQILEASSLERTLSKLMEARDLFLEQSKRTRDKKKLMATVNKMMAATKAMVEVKIQNDRASRILTEALQLARK